MNTIRLVLIALICSLAVASPAEAQNYKKKDRQLRRVIKKRAVRDARKESRKLRRQGYYVAPGAIPLDRQIEEAWKRQYDRTDDGFPVYIIATGNAVANTSSAAKLQATELAKLELAGSISTQVMALIESNIANEQLSTREANSVSKTVAASTNTIAANLGRTLVLVEIYRKVKKTTNIEASVRMAYNSKKAMEMAKKSIRKQLEEATELTREKLDKLMNFD